MRTLRLYEPIYEYKRHQLMSTDNVSVPRFRCQRTWKIVLEQLDFKPAPLSSNPSSYSGLFATIDSKLCAPTLLKCWKKYRLIRGVNYAVFIDNEDCEHIIEDCAKFLYTRNYCAVTSSNDTKIYKDTPWNEYIIPICPRLKYIEVRLIDPISDGIINEFFYFNYLHIMDYVTKEILFSVPHAYQIQGITRRDDNCGYHVWIIPVFHKKGKKKTS